MNRRFALPAAVAFAVAAASLLPGGHAPTAAGLPWDKVLHASGGGTLVLAAAWATRRRDARALLALAVAAALFGGALEVGQSLVPSRDPSVFDFLADALGAAAAAVAIANRGLSRRARSSGRA